MEITAVMIAHNESLDLPACLESWNEVCNEIVLVNDQSTDDTKEIARYYGARVIDAAMDDLIGFSGLRNIGLETVQTSHALSFDADEKPNRELLNSIHQAVSQGTDTTAYRISRRNWALGGWLDHGRFSPDWQTRLFPSDVRYARPVHELPQLSPATELRDLEGIIEHFSYATVAEYVTKMRHYARRQAQYSEPPSRLHMMAFPAYNFLARNGYRDGWRGLLMALGDGWHDHLLRKYSRERGGGPLISQAATGDELKQTVA